MSMDKAIKSGNEHRKPYYDSRASDKGCRYHGVCLWCAQGRLHKKVKQMPVDENGKIVDPKNFG